MHHYLPFIVTIIMFILVWGALIQLPYIESISSNKAIAYATFSLYVSVIIFVILGAIYRCQNIQICKENLKKDFLISVEDIFNF